MKPLLVIVAEVQGCRAKLAGILFVNQQVNTKALHAYIRYHALTLKQWLEQTLCNHESIEAEVYSLMVKLLRFGCNYFYYIFSFTQTLLRKIFTDTMCTFHLPSLTTCAINSWCM